ncbi:unnamed protein product [Staurois parvus]|uniref:Uncharacterized protein n=1 Tax=Staurois parvus TaxID=386267 RepID=A0ABN9GAP6_9NEOB|nr:unnamed protein product [Staurois parvus]
MYKKIKFFKMFKFAAGSGARYVPSYGDRNTEAGIGRRRWPGTLQGTHCRSEGQSKRCRNSLSNTAW